MAKSRAGLWQQLVQLAPLCSGSLHEQYLRCGKPVCSCHHESDPQLHGPYYLWVRRMGGKQVNRTLRPGPELEQVRQGIANYQRFQQLFSQLLEHDEGRVLGRERAAAAGGKKNSRRRLSKR